MILRIADLLDGALRGAGLEATSTIWKIAEAWPQIVGPRIATHATPVRLRRGELTLAAPEATWRQELALLGPEIAASVNKKIKGAAVERIRLTSAPLPLPSRRHRRRLRPPAAGSTHVSAAELAEPAAEARPAVAAAIGALADTRARRLRADGARPLDRRRRR